MDTDPYVKALRELCVKAGGPKAVADKARISADNLSQILAGTKLPSGNARGVGPGLRASLSKAFPQWLDLGLGKVTVPQMEPLSNSNLELPQYQVAGGMGNGLVLEDKQPGVIKSWCVDREWLRLNVPHYTAAKNLCIVTGFGPSMRPKYNPGDPLLLDRGVTAVETEGIYFFRVGTHGYIKQLQRIPVEDGLIIRAKSLNKDYDPFDITSKMDFEVFGKVLTVWRSEQV